MISENFRKIREKLKLRQKRSVAKKEAQVPTPLKGDKK
jgi:hypothetical protein